MSDASSASEFAGQAGFGYRRGFVLGLTLAEAALLLVFVVMLLLVVGFDRRERRIAELERLQSAAVASAPSGVDPIEYSVNQLQVLAELQNVATASGHAWDDDFIELVRTVAAAPSDDGLVDVRKAIKDERERLQDLVSLLEGEEGGRDLVQLATAVAEKDAAISNYRGQIVNLRDKLTRSGKGGDLPSCWMTPEGKIDYLLDVVLDPQGIRVRESSPPHRKAERDRLPMRAIPSGTLYSTSSFLSATRGVFDWSVANECRFYVVVYDGTGSHQKQLYKDLLRTAEGHFYKREERRAPPF